MGTDVKLAPPAGHCALRAAREALRGNPQNQRLRGARWLRRRPRQAVSLRSQMSGAMRRAQRECREKQPEEDGKVTQLGLLIVPMVNGECSSGAQNLALSGTRAYNRRGMAPESCGLRAGIR